MTASWVIADAEPSLRPGLVALRRHARARARARGAHPWRAGLRRRERARPAGRGTRPAMVLALYELAWRPAAASSVAPTRRRARSNAGAAAPRRRPRVHRAAGATGPSGSLPGSAHARRRGVAAAAHRHRRRPRQGRGLPSEDAALAAVDRRRNVVPAGASCRRSWAPWSSAPTRGTRGPATRAAWSGGTRPRGPCRTASGCATWRTCCRRASANARGRPAADLGREPRRQSRPHDLDESEREIREAAGFFEEAFRGTAAGPAWLTLNLSCPNTEDDPRGTQSGELAERLCGALATVTRLPLWVKVGPDLSDEQLQTLIRACCAARGACHRGHQHVGPPRAHGWR